MNTPSITVKVLEVKYEYDRTNEQEVYKAARFHYPHLTAKELTPELIENLIPKGACPRQWIRTLRNVESSLNQPKKSKARRSRSKVGCYNRKHNPAEAVARRLVTDALMGVA